MVKSFFSWNRSEIRQRDKERCSSHRTRLNWFRVGIDRIHWSWLDSRRCDSPVRIKVRSRRRWMRNVDGNDGSRFSDRSRCRSLRLDRRCVWLKRRVLFVKTNVWIEDWEKQAGIDSRRLFATIKLIMLVICRKSHGKIEREFQLRSTMICWWAVLWRWLISSDGIWERPACWQSTWYPKRWRRIHWSSRQNRSELYPRKRNSTGRFSGMMYLREKH